MAPDIQTNAPSIYEKSDPSGQTLAFVDFDFRSCRVYPRCSASSATYAAAQADSGSSAIIVKKSLVGLN